MKKQFSFRATPANHEYLKAFAGREDETLNALLNRLVRLLRDRNVRSLADLEKHLSNGAAS